MKLESLIEAYNRAVEEVERLSAEWDALPDDADAETISAAKDGLDNALDVADAAKEAVDQFKAVERSREKHAKLALDESKAPKIEKVTEPDMYQRGSGAFIRDLYLSQLRNDPGATSRIARHQEYEVERHAQRLGVDVEKYAVSTATLGGVIPPQYLVDMYAKAPRNGRIFADQANRKPLPDVGMSLIVPRLTGGTAAGVQASEGSTATTADPTETDLTIPVRTIAGYSPVSRQTLERAAYSEDILFEDLVARYYQSLDVQCLNGSGSSGQILGAIQTSGVSSSTTSTATIAGVWGKIADIIQQINTAVGGLGYQADKIFMTPARWGWFTAALDSQNRPLFNTYAQPVGVTVIGKGDEAGYGPVGFMHGLPVFTDANIPNNLGGGTNQDDILVTASQVVHLWERDDDPVTLAFEQQAGTSLQVQLIAYGYAAFTAGRYPAATGIVSGTGLVTPTF